MTLSTEILGCISDRWAVAVGDPSVLGWAIFAAYGVTALLCAYSFRRATDRVSRMFWLGVSALLLLLMLNKQLDLQSAMTVAGRCIALSGGWFDLRRQVQAVFAVVAILAGIALGASVIFYMRQHFKSHWQALLGLFLLVGFVLLRAGGALHLDERLGVRMNDPLLNAVLELGGLILIAANAIRNLAKHNIEKRHSRSD